ncbi:MAG TPA: SCO family protein [Tepidisphaeraceae bacterium]|jgi:cytochrome oxidase Cu insertion factor (SCO1/SenC/PrrC family)|nr:SCO family protein [Tepidisphaeraceae bacterium]
MTRTQKSLTITLWALLVIAMVSFVASGMWRPREPEHFFEVPEFHLVDQNNKPFTKHELAGKVWIADFVFTQCAGPCPLMTLSMVELQKELAGTPIQLVSISVDPTRDTPEVLRKYAQSMKADEKNWTFATGEPDEVFSLAAAMKIPASPADGQNSILHSEKFILVDEKGWIRGWYFYKDPEKRSQLIEEARRLASKGS